MEVPMSSFAESEIQSNTGAFNAKATRPHSSGINILRSSSQRHSRDLEAQLAEPLGSWKIGDIDWRFIFGVQHYGTAVTALAILIALIVVHWTLQSTERVFFLYDASISYVSHGDTVPAWSTVVVPLVCFGLSLFAYEFCIYRSFNHHITNAMATAIHFLLDCICAFITVEFVTELTKFLAGRLRPNFLQDCFTDENGLRNELIGPAVLGDNTIHPVQCNKVGTNAGRKSFPSGHSSVSCAIMTYHIVYLIWAGYFRAEGASFLGLKRQSGWRGGHRFLREMGHGLYLFWILCQFAFVWAVGVSRFNDNKHNISDILGGWFLGAMLGIIYSTRGMALHQYVVLHNVLNRHGQPGR